MAPIPCQLSSVQHFHGVPLMVHNFTGFFCNSKTVTSLIASDIFEWFVSNAVVTRESKCFRFISAFVNVHPK